jgi:predicted PurR-regulated permease PerM
VATEDAARGVRVQRTGLTRGSAFLLVGAVVTAFLLADAFVAAHRTIGWVVACAIVALLIDPVVDFVQRVMPRWLAVIVVLIGLLAIIAAVAAGVASDLVDSLEELTESAPTAAADLEEQHDVLADINLAQRVQDFVDEMDDRIRRDALSTATATFPAYIVTGILMLFLLAYGRRYFDGFVEQLPRGRQADVRTVAGQAALRGRRYLLVTLAHSVVNGVVVGLVCSWIGLPAAIALGFAVGVLTPIPLIGVLVGGIPAVLLAFGLEDWAGFVILAVLVALQVGEAAVVRPVVDARSVRVGPTVAVVVALLGFELYGVGGAVYGVALAVIGLAALDELGRVRGRAAS